MIIEFKGMRPDVEKATFIADSATLSGDIHLAENTSVWFGASLRRLRACPDGFPGLHRCFLRVLRNFGLRFREHRV